MEIIKKIDIADSEFFHTDDIKLYDLEKLLLIQNTWILRKSLEFLKYGLLVDKAELSALLENEASIKTILANGGVYRDSIYIEKEDVMLNRYFIDLSEV